MASGITTVRIIELAAIISNSVTKLHEILSEQGLPSPSFDEDAPTSLPKEATNAQDAVLDATSELRDLLLDPLNLLFQHGGHNNMVSLQAISRLKIASIVPPGGQMSFADIAKLTGLNEATTKRLLRHAMTMHVFWEPRPGMVAHTKISKQLALPDMNDWMSTGSEEMWPAATKMVDALQKWPDSQKPNETAFSLANNTTDSIYSIICADPARAVRFAGAMKAYASSPGYETSHILDNYDWEGVGQGLVVDIGGAQGHVGMELATRFKNLKILVQDMDKVVEHAAAGMPADLASRVKFMAHDFFAPQSVQADVYYFRWILHNWSNKYCILILRAQIPALKPGARIVIQDTCMPEPGTIARWKEKDLRSADLNMQAIFNSQERTINEWKALFQQADPRFEFMDVKEPKGSALAIIDVRWNGAS